MTTIDVAAGFNSFGSAPKKIYELEEELKRNRKMAKQGLVIIGLGFSLQIISLSAALLR